MKTILFLLTLSSFFSTPEPCVYFSDLPAAKMKTILSCSSLIVGGEDPGSEFEGELKYDVEFQQLLPYTYRVKMTYSQSGDAVKGWGEIVIIDTDDGPKLTWIRHSMIVDEYYGEGNWNISGILRVQDKKIISPDCVIDQSGTSLQVVFI